MVVFDPHNGTLTSVIVFILRDEKMTFKETHSFIQYILTECFTVCQVLF